MRLAPLEDAPTAFGKVVFWIIRRFFGRLPTPYGVVFSRLPQALFAHVMVVSVLDRKLKLDPELRLLVSNHIAALNGCTFCVDITRAVAVQRKIPLDKVQALSGYRSDPRFSARERAALSYVEEAHRDRRVTEDTFATLRAHFSEREIVEITWLGAVESYFNMINVPLAIESDGFCVIPSAGTPGRSRGSSAQGGSSQASAECDFQQ